MSEKAKEKINKARKITGSGCYKFTEIANVDDLLVDAIAELESQPDLQKAIELLGKLADENSWEKNKGGYWVYSGTCPFVIAKEIPAELEKQPGAGEFTKELEELIGPCCACTCCVHGGKVFGIIHCQAEEIKRLVKDTAKQGPLNNKQ